MRLEGYARVNEGAWVAVIQHLPTSSPWSLGSDMYGISFTRKEQSVALGTLDGIWKSTDAEQRFRLNVSGAVFKLTERNSAGTELVRDARVQFDDDGTVKISRLNDDEVLNFLGFQPSLRAEMRLAARAPHSSGFRSPMAACTQTGMAFWLRRMKKPT